LVLAGPVGTVPLGRFVPWEKGKLEEQSGRNLTDGTVWKKIGRVKTNWSFVKPAFWELGADVKPDP
jgi:hypothetical protein